MSSYNYHRSWIDRPHMDPNTRLLTPEFESGIKEFMGKALNQPEAETGMLRCPCSTCKNRKVIKQLDVWTHLYIRGFTRSYKVWYHHGETDYEYGSTSEPQPAVRLEEPIRTGVDYGVGTEQMVNDHFRGEDLPNAEAMRFYAMLDAGKQPLYEGCRDGHSALSSATRLMSIKSDYNLAEDCVDAIADFVKGVLPEDNVAPGSYYEVQKLVAGLGLSYQVIDVCRDNCMIYWRADEQLDKCKFCRKARYKDTSGRVPVPYKRMWYLPLTERLQRLYMSERTAQPMRWHAEHSTDGEIRHPSDAKAWKHFQSTYPEFAYERRNVYLGLCTDGFSPFGKHGRQYSLWPVILTPYNLPPNLCLRREFLFLSILVPGPEHPRRSLDVFLQPLIYELQQLWGLGAETYDVSCKENFQMRAVLMWTVSDFPAYGMLSGWTTHGRLSCPHCQANTDAFQLKHGRKTCWFDCHRRFLPADHPYRRSRKLFTKNKRVFDSPPPEISGREMLTQLRDFGAERTPDVGGHVHYPVDAVGDLHNWHKKSIFWDLPYWKDHLLRHNLDVMHIEKNFFDNLMNTILNVQGKTKDNLKSRLDLVDICAREELHVDENGRAPFPIYRLDAAAKDAFFDWISMDVEFPDGYASNLRNCVDRNEGKFTGLKSHDCHVMMQRLLPFAFKELLPRNVYEAVAGISAFFRDLCTRSVTPECIENLKTNIAVITCNLEKIFPPSFFDVMEHLVIHLPKELELGGPVQYRWMYLYERYMFHLKKMVKNLSRVEGSIVAQFIRAETSNFAEHYFPGEVQTKTRKPARHDDRGERATYYVKVPDIFTDVGRLSGKAKNRRLTEEEHSQLQTYLLTNCEDVLQYERIFMAEKRFEYRYATEQELEALKQREFAGWMHTYVSDGMARGETFDDWLREMVWGPKYFVKSYPRFASRGYAFTTSKRRRSSTTYNAGVCSAAGDDVYYGNVREILEIMYPGMVGLRCTVFYCDWYDNTPDRGVRTDAFGVTSVHSRRKLPYYDPFILASQADQVCYIKYPRVTNRDDPWVTVTSLNPRGRVQGSSELEDPLQPNASGNLSATGDVAAVDLVIDLTDFGDEAVVHVEDEPEIGEFHQDPDSDSSGGDDDDSGSADEPEFGE